MLGPGAHREDHLEPHVPQVGQQVAGYLAKYATKATEDTGYTSTAQMTRQAELFGPGAPEAVEAARAGTVKPLRGSAA